MQNDFQRRLGSIPVIRTTSRPDGARRRVPEAGRAPAELAPAFGVEADVRPVDLEVVVVLRVDRGQQLRLPRDQQVVDRVGCCLAGVVPTLEGGDHDGVGELALDLDADHPASLRRPGVEGWDVACCLTSRPLGWFGACSVPRPAPRARRTRRRRGRGDGHDAAAARPDSRRLRGPRGLQRDPQRQSPRRGSCDPRRLLRGGRGLRRHEHVRRQLRQPR